MKVDNVIVKRGTMFWASRNHAQIENGKQNHYFIPFDDQLAHGLVLWDLLHRNQVLCVVDWDF